MVLRNDQAQLPLIRCSRVFEDIVLWTISVTTETLNLNFFLWKLFFIAFFAYWEHFPS